MDALAIALDEVALEGLDGITLSSLWIRLESRQPPFPLTLDAMTREYVWRFLVSSEDEVSFYLLPQDRPPVTLYDRSVLLIFITYHLRVSNRALLPTEVHYLGHNTYFTPYVVCFRFSRGYIPLFRVSSIKALIQLVIG